MSYHVFLNSTLSLIRQLKDKVIFQRDKIFEILIQIYANEEEMREEFLVFLIDQFNFLNFILSQIETLLRILSMMH